MGSTIDDYFYEQHLEDLHLAEKIDEGIENFKKESLKSFYLKNSDIYIKISRVRKVAKDVEKEHFLSPAFIFYNICIELILKNLFIYPLVYGVLLDEEFAEVIIAEIFKTPISKFDRIIIFIVQKFGNVDITKKHDFLKRVPWEEVKKLRGMRNKILHSGTDCKEKDLRRIKNLTNFLFQKIVPEVFKGVDLKINNHNMIVEE